MTRPFRQYGVIFLLVCLFLIVAAALYKAPPTHWDRAAQFADFINSKGMVGVLVFIVLGTLATSVGLPRQFFAFAAGYSFGVTAGLFVSSLAAILGCALTFYCSRRYLSKWVCRRYPKAIVTLNKLVERDAFLKIVALRLQPLGTNLVTNLCAGVSEIKPMLFFSSSWLGYLPQMLVFCLLGAGIRIGSNTYLLISVSLLALSCLIAGVVYKRYVIRAPIHEHYK